MTPFEKLLAGELVDPAVLLRKLCRCPNQPPMVVVDEITAAARKVLELYQAEVAVTQCGSSEVTMVWFRLGAVLNSEAGQIHFQGTPFTGASIVMPGEVHVLGRCEQGDRTVLRVLSPPDLEQAK